MEKTQKKSEKSKFTEERLLRSAIPFVALYFMFFIYLPSDSFINNSIDFHFAYQYFIGYGILFFVVATLISVLLVMLLPGAVHRIFMALVTGLDICVYIQYVFLNQNLILLDGETVAWEKHRVFSAVTLIVWIVLLVLFLVMELRFSKFYEKIRLKLPFLLFAVQFVSLIIMIILAGTEIFKVKADFMSGREQFVVSSKKNVVVFMLDAVDNIYFEKILAENPEAFQGYEDFTLYKNTCSVFDSTPTSTTQMFTGMEFCVELPGTEWYEQAWSSDRANAFFDRFHKAGYTINGYSIETDSQSHYLGKFDNCQEYTDMADMDIDALAMSFEFNKLALYRALPFVFKKYVEMENVNFNAHFSLKNKVCYDNQDFAEQLSLSLSDSDKNYLIVQHLNGTHYPCSDQIGETEYLLEVLRDYMDQMKELGVYENASIIITSDHGEHNDAHPEFGATPILMIKKSNVSSDEMTISDAPVYHKDFQATMLDCAGLYNKATDEKLFGRSVFDIAEDEQRERTWYDRGKDSDFEKVQSLSSTSWAWSGCNVYYSYTYTGDANDLRKMVAARNITKIYQMTDNKG
ncbi:MAG: hypothetical protein ACI4HQ_15130 [Acetatifactor sp.]